jgi:hypothetical protein
MGGFLQRADDAVIQEALRASIEQRACILIAGSGLSSQARTADGRNPPAWKGLLNGMITWCLGRSIVDPDTATEFHKAVEMGFLIEAGQEIEEILAEPSLRQECLREVLLINDAQIGEAHELIASIPFRGYLTTNYDTYIETAYSIAYRRPINTFFENTIDSVLEEYRRERPFLLKLHGDINQRDLIILGDRSYQRLVQGDTDYRRCLQSLVSDASVLFVGFGGTDPNLDRLMAAVAAFDGRRQRHWMLMPSGGLPELKAKRLLKDRGIIIVEYERDEGHTRLVEFLRKLAARSAPKLRDGGVVGAVDTMEISAKIEEFASH